MSLIRNMQVRAFCRNSGDPALQALVPLRNSAMLSRVAAELDDGYSEAKQLATGPFQDFIEWLLANGPELIAFVKMLIDLFSKPSQTPAPSPA